MKILIYGSNGFIGSKIKEFLLKKAKTNHSYIIIDGIERCDDQEKCENEIKLVSPECVLCCIGRSSGKNIYSTSYIEDKLDINIKDNLFGQMVLVKLCNKYNIHLTHIGDGCIFYDDMSEHKISKHDMSEHKHSSHSIVKLYTEKLIKLFSNNYLHLRLKYPVSNDFSPKCLLSKLASFDKVVNKNTSITILDDVLPIIVELISKKITGTYNLVNPETINLIDLKLALKKNIDDHLLINEYDINEHNNEIGKRSHIALNCDKIMQLHQIPKVNKSLTNKLINMKQLCQSIIGCLCCKSENKLLIDLGYQPLANDFHEKNHLCSIFPLRLMYCPNCFHCQLSHAVNPNILFKNYKYVSGTSQTSLDFFKSNADFINNYKQALLVNENKALLVNENKGFILKRNILDIACNDGSQLDYFKELDWNTYGIDPATNLCPIAEAKGHKIICDFWSIDSAKKLPIMDVITAQNVFAHTQYLDDFLSNCKLIMDENTSLFIQTSQRDMIINGEFDTTYHEHISFFNTKSMNYLVKRNGLFLNRVLEHSIHGRSYIFEIKLAIDFEIYNVDEHLEFENNLGLYNSITYDKFSLNAKRCVKNLNNQINIYRNKTEYKCIGFGAAAKGQIVLCYGNIDLDYIIDENSLKTNLYSPKLDIPIVNLDYFINDKCDKFLVVILAWNFAKEIKEKINKIKGNKTVIVIEKYFPEIIMNNLP